MRSGDFGIRTAWRQTQVLDARGKRIVAVGRWFIGKLVDRVIDRYYLVRGLDTRGPDFGPDPEGGLLGYVASDWRVLGQIFPKGSVTADDVVLEYGAGKGRVLIWLATRFAPRRAIGVERDRDLTRSAESNLLTWRGGAVAERVSMVCADARDFDVPDDVTVIYFFNPFMGQVFDDVLTKVCESLRRAPRPLRVAYLYPIMHDSLINAGFELVRSRRHIFHAWAVYSTSA